MSDLLFHVVFGPDLDPDFPDIGMSLSGLAPGEFGDDWIPLDADRAAKVRAAMRPPRPDEHPPEDECGVCQAMKEEGAVPIMLAGELVRELAPNVLSGETQH